MFKSSLEVINKESPIESISIDVRMVAVKVLLIVSFLLFS